MQKQTYQFSHLEPLAFKIAYNNHPNATIIDVRKPSELSEGMMDGAMVINYRKSDFTQKIAALPRDRAYFVYCQNGKRSQKTCMLMENMGFEEVANLNGGWSAWEATFIANNNQSRPSVLRIGDVAPDFEAVATTGQLKLSDYQGEGWLLMVSHPADFTPVCTTELAALAREKAFFDDRNTKLLGLSIDSIHAHLAWMNNIREKLGVTINFPIIADHDMKVAQLYGMMHPNESTTSTVRAAFFIDPQRIVRLAMYYPVNVGRGIAEIKRALTALQTAQNNDCSLPADWNEGDKGIANAPQTVAEMQERLNRPKEEGDIDFYLVNQPIDEE